MARFTPSDIQTLEQIMSSRRDVRGNRFLPKALQDAALDKILNAGLSAPSVGFSQPWRFVVVRSQATKMAVKASFDVENKNAIEQFSDDKQDLYRQLKLEGIVDAPVNVAVFYQPSVDPVLGQTSMSNTGVYSVVCAIQNMWLMARALEVGLGWVSIVDPEAVKQLLNAPRESELVGYLCLGYVDEFLDSPELEQKGWDRRKPFDEVVFSESF
ncbi:MAG: 5,6-dimethylbenzimidazole synthase [Candidatus Azotimanducaceae bacterium]|jgi:5,6-dimethylbenzimidazole synthase